jgi:hypothetical protein
MHRKFFWGRAAPFSMTGRNRSVTRFCLPLPVIGVLTCQFRLYSKRFPPFDPAPSLRDGVLAITYCARTIDVARDLESQTKKLQQQLRYRVRGASHL